MKISVLIVQQLKPTNLIKIIGIIIPKKGFQNWLSDISKPIVQNSHFESYILVLKLIFIKLQDNE